MEKINPKCSFHPNQPIINYCTQVNCNVQLCAACICEHTDDHNCINTKPKYEQIQDTYNMANDKIKRLKQAIFVQKSRVTAIIDKIAKQSQQCNKLLRQARQDTIATVNKAFDELETSFNNHLEQEKQKSGLLNQSRLSQIFSDLNQQNLQVYNITRQLDSRQNPKIIKITNGQFIPKLQDYLRQISKELSINDQFHPNVTYRSSNLSEVSAAVKKLISTAVTYTVPNNEYYRNKSISRSKQTQLRPLNILNCNRQPSIRKSKLIIDTKSPKASEINKHAYAATAKENYFPVPNQANPKFAHTYY